MNILLVTDYNFPYGEAWSRRASNLYKLFIECGHIVHVIARYADNISDEDKISYKVEYVEFSYDSIIKYTLEKKNRYAEAIVDCVEKERINLIISSDMDYVYHSILHIAKKYHIPYIIEQCEWYDITSFPGGRLNPKYWLFSYNIRWGYLACDGVIAISTYLEKHFSKKRRKVIRIPAIEDVSSIIPRIESKSADVVNIGLFGTIGKNKENISAVMKAVARINKREKRVHFHIYGPNSDIVRKTVGDEMFTRCEKCITVYGRIHQKDVLDKLKEMDYSVVIRPNRRSSNAGFPTKVVESMTVGTPCIFNKTGDIGLYLKDGYNAIETADDSDEQVYQGIKKVLDISDEDRINMRKMARNTAMAAFDYKCYKSEMGDFLNNYEFL